MQFGRLSVWVGGLFLYILGKCERYAGICDLKIREFDMGKWRKKI